MTEALDKLRFEIYERVQLPEEISSLQELEELELIPHMQTLPGEDHVQIRGHLLLTGVYRGESAESPLRQLEHWIPMEISLPMYRVGRLEELTVDVEQFDVDLVSGRTLNVTGTLTLRGVQGGPAPEREWDGDGLRVVHRAPPPEIWPGLSGEVPVQASVYRLQGDDGADVVGLESTSETYAPPPAAGETGAARYAESESDAALPAAGGSGAMGSAGGEDEPASGSRQPQAADEPAGETPGEEVASIREIPVPEPSGTREEPAAADGAGDAPYAAETSSGEEAFAAREAESSVQAEAAYGEADAAMASESGRNAPASDVSAPDERPSVKVTLSGKREPSAAGPSAEPVGWHSLIGLRAEREPSADSADEGFQSGAAGDVRAGGGEARNDRRAAAESEADNAAMPTLGGEAEPAAERAEAAPGDELDWARLFRVRGGEVSPFTRVRLYIVQEDESLESVAERYQVHARLLQRFNNLTESYVTKGQVLYIPRL